MDTFYILFLRSFAFPWAPYAPPLFHIENVHRLSCFSLKAAETSCWDQANLLKFIKLKNASKLWMMASAYRPCFNFLARSIWTFLQQNPSLVIHSLKIEQPMKIRTVHTHWYFVNKSSWSDPILCNGCLYLEKISGNIPFMTSHLLITYGTLTEKYTTMF